MKRLSGTLENFIVRIAFLAFAASLVFSFSAAAATAASGDEKKLSNEASDLDHLGGTPKGETAVMQKLEKEFNVPGAAITGLRSQKLGYGEIAIVLGLASKEPGGVTDANIGAIMALRKGPPVMGWGEIAKKFRVNLGSVVSAVHKVGTESRSELGMGERTDHGKGMMGGSGPDQRGGPDRMDHGGGMGHGR